MSAPESPALAVSSHSGAVPPPAAQYARPDGKAWFVLGILCFVYVLNFLDRQIISILAKPIQDELGITDGQLGRITGLYFALVYCILGIPVAWIADRTNRVKVLSVACAIWSAATLFCGMARNYPQLVVGRLAVGVGEAGGVPPSYAIISDYFPPGRRGTALALFNFGPPIGMALGVAFGTSIAAAFDWRIAFISLGIIGLTTAVFVWFFVPEPKKGGLDAPAPVQAETAGPAPGFWGTMRMFFTRPVLLLTALASGAIQFVTYATLNFTTLFLMREKDMTLQELALYYSVLLGVGIAAGMYVSGWLVDRFGQKSKVAYAIVPAVGLAAAIPFFLGFVWAPTWPLALLFLIGPTFFNYFYLSPAVTLVQEEVRPQERVLAGALLLLIMNLIGLGLGPTWLGMMSEWFGKTNPENSLQLAFYTLTPFYALAVVLFIWLAHAIRKEEAGKAIET
ncbi:MAG TPA: MFS transporter [Hyphomonas sp.]|nr:MFS transporter [Hyphomonas sp.]